MTSLKFLATDRRRQIKEGWEGCPWSWATQSCLSQGVTCESTLIFHGIRVPASKSQLKPVKQGHSMQLSARRLVGHKPMSETISDLSDVTHFMCATVFPSPTSPSSGQMCRLLLLCFRFSWLLNWKLIYFCTNSPLPGLAQPWPRIRQSTYHDARTLSLLLFVTPTLSLALSLSRSYCYLSSLRRQCKIFWHKVNSIFDYYLNRFLSHWAQQFSVPSSRRCYSYFCSCCCRSYAHACDMSYSCLFTEPTRNAAHKRDLKEKK